MISCHCDELCAH